MRLRFATLNVWALTWPIGRSVAARMEAIGSALPGLALDAIAFQEVWRQDARDALIAAGWRAGLREFWFDADDGTSGGLLLLSRAPIGSASFTPYALRGRAHRIWHADYYGRKGFLLCTLDTAAGPVALAVTHLHAQYREGAHPEYATYRAAQVVELASALRDVRDPLITAGDFNFEEASPEYRVWTGLAGVADAATLLDRREPTVLSDHPYTAPPGRDERIDYLFVRPGIDRGARVLKVERVFDTPPPEIAGAAAYSDHCGVLAEIDVAAPGAPSRDPDPRSLEEAAALLAVGRSLTTGRRRASRIAAGAGLGTAVAAWAGARTATLGRRALLRRGLHTAACAALPAGIGFALASEIFQPAELRAFDVADAALQTLGVPRSR